MHYTTSQMTTESRHYGWRLNDLLCFGLLCFGLMWSSSGQAQTLEAFSQEEYQRKANFILSFCRLSNQPEMPIQSPDENLVIGVLGEDPLTPYIDALAGEKCRKHDIEVAHYSITDDYTQPRALFIGSSEQHRLADILARLNGKSVLTIGDFEGFAEAGGMVGFTYLDMPKSTLPNARRVRFKINPEVAEAAQTSCYEIMCRLSPRVPRRFVQSEALPTEQGQRRPFANHTTLGPAKRGSAALISAPLLPTIGLGHDAPSHADLPRQAAG